MSGKGKNKLIEIWNDTKQYFRKYKPSQQSILYDIYQVKNTQELKVNIDEHDDADQAKNQAENTIQVEKLIIGESTPPHSSSQSSNNVEEPSQSEQKEEEENQCKNEVSRAILDIRDTDTISMSVEYVDEGLNPLVLNMASDRIPGGGVAKGSSAQEECLFRCTNAFQTHDYDLYPLPPNHIIYSPEVVICKDYNYKYIEERRVSMIACAAIRNPQLTDRGEYKTADADLMRAKIDAIFQIALKHGHDSLVLSALGCGAFTHPPDKVAQLFKRAVRRYRTKFKKIGFAILVAKSTDSRNFTEFQKAFEHQM